MTTNDRGDYVVTPLNPRIYRVSVTLDGFQTALVEAVEVQVGQSARVDVELKIGAVTESTTVSSGTPLLDTESGTLGHVVTNTQIVNLPLNGRSFYELARLTPGAVLLPGGGNLLRIRANYISGTAVSGVRGSQTTFMLDGVDVTDHHQGGSLIQTSVDALQEFKVQQSAYSAEFSQSGGALNATTKSGSDQLHGALFDFMRNDAFDARNFFALQTEELKRQQFGGTLGGPIFRKRTFFFASYEGMRERQGLVFNNTVPTAAMRGGDFSASSRTIYDPLTRQPFLNNVIPAGRLSPQALYFARFLPDPNTASGTFSWAPVRELNSDQATVRIDQTVGDRNRIFGRYSFHDQRLVDPNQYPALGNAPLSTRGQNVVLGMTNTLSSSLLHDIRFSYVPAVVNLEAYLQGTDQYQAAGVRGFEETARPGVGGSFPDFSWSGYTAMNGSAFDQRPKTQDLKVWEVTDNITWITGRHILKFGGKFRRWVPLFTDSKQYAGQWSFDGSITQNPASPAGTGDAFADFLLGYPRQVTRAFPADTFGGQANYWHGYLQDDFKVSSRLTVNVGCATSTPPGCPAIAARSARSSPARRGRSSSRARATCRISSRSLRARRRTPSSRTRFRPATRPGSRSSSRSPTGRSSGRASVSPGSRSATGPWCAAATGSSTSRRARASREQQHGALQARPDVLQRSGAARADDGRLLSRHEAHQLRGAVDRRERPRPEDGPRPSLQPRHAAGDRALHRARGELRRQHRPLPGRHDQHQHSGARGGRHSGAAAVSAVWRHQLLRRHAGDDLPFAADVGRAAHARGAVLPGVLHVVEEHHDAERAGCRRQRGAREGALGVRRAAQPRDQRRLRAAVRPRPALLRSANAAVDAVLGGWQIQGIYVWRSGRPFTPTISSDRANTGVGGQRPNRIGSGELDDPTVAVWFDKTAFVLPAQFTYGNSGGSILREDTYKTLDFSLFKQFRIGTHRLQFRAETFNMTNTPSFNAPNSAIDTAAGGRVTSTSSTPRQMQFALKYNF